jgi:hypothetical protein
VCCKEGSTFLFELVVIPTAVEILFIGKVFLLLEGEDDVCCAFEMFFFVGDDVDDIVVVIPFEMILAFECVFMLDLGLCFIEGVEEEEEEE